MKKGVFVFLESFWKSIGVVRIKFFIAFIKKLIYGPVRVVLLDPGGNPIEFRMRTNWPLIYWDRLRAFFYRKRHLFYFRKFTIKIIRKRE